MKTKKLRSIIFAFILTFFAFVNVVKAVGPFYFKTTGTSPHLAASWTNNSNGVGGVSPTAGNMTSGAIVWNFYNSTGAVASTMTAAWAPGGGSTINLGNVNTTSLLTNAFKINRSGGAGTVTLNVTATGTLNISTITAFGVGVTLAPAANSTVIYSIAGATISNVAYGNLNFTANNTLGISTINNSFTNSATANMNSLALTVGSVVNTGVIIMGSGGTNLKISTDLNNTGSISIVSSSNVTINGTATSIGTIKGDGTGYLINAGTSSATLNMDLSAVGTTNCMLELQNTGSGTITLGNALCIAAGGDITPVSGIIDVGAGNLTLLAAQGQTGAIGSIGGILLGASINSQAYHNPNGNATNWTTMGVAGVTNANFQAWRSGFPITCASCIDGSTVSGVAFTSVTSYDETQTGGGDFSNAAHYIDLPSDANTINNGQGYWVYMGNSSPGTGTGAEVITVSGTPQQGSIPLNFTFTDASNGANLLANPFPSPISWSTVMANNPAATIDGVCYIYNAQDGSYGTLDAAGLASGSYGLSDDVIPTGMAFYVQAMASGSLVFDESVKSVGSTQDLQRQSSHNIKTQAAQIPRFSIQALGTNMQSRTLFAFDSRANIGIDHTLDAPYLVGSEPIRISSQISGKDFSINGLPDLNQNYSIPVKMVVTTTGSYQISALNLQNMPTGACLILHDNSDNSNYDLRQGSHAITLNSTDVGARFVLNISITTLAITANATQATCPASHDGYITAAGNNAGPWNYTWKNANNTIVRTTTNLATADILNGLNTGVYSVDVNTVGTCDNATQSFTLTLPATVNSAFSVTSNTVFVNNNMTFTDNSTNANSYWWDFGDGNNSSLQSPVYAYNTIGTIDITFYAINTVCGDTAISTQSIDVLSTMGIAGGVANGDIILSKDQNGTFIKFNYGGQTKVNINVYNALGQTILTNTGVNVANDKIYLNLDNAKDQLVFVSIANLDKNTQVTKKLYNN